MGIMFTGECDTRSFTVELRFSRKLLYYVKVSIEDPEQTSHEISIYCKADEDYDELVTECFNRALDLASQLIRSARKVKMWCCGVSRCVPVPRCVS